MPVFFFTLKITNKSRILSSPLIFSFVARNTFGVVSFHFENFQLASCFANFGGNKKAPDVECYRYFGKGFVGMNFVDLSMERVRNAMPWGQSMLPHWLALVEEARDVTSLVRDANQHAHGNIEHRRNNPHTNPITKDTDNFIMSSEEWSSKVIENIENRKKYTWVSKARLYTLSDKRG